MFQDEYIKANWTSEGKSMWSSHEQQKKQKKRDTTQKHKECQNVSVLVSWSPGPTAKGVLFRFPVVTQCHPRDQN